MFPMHPVNRRKAILGVLAVAVSQDAQAQTYPLHQTITINLDAFDALDIWYKGQLVTLSSQEIFIALGGAPVIEGDQKGGQ